MNHYEIMLVIQPNRGDQVASMVASYIKFIETDSGVIHRAEHHEKSNKTYFSGYYVLLNIECTSETLGLLKKERFIHNDDIHKILIIKQTQARKEPSVLNTLFEKDAKKEGQTKYQNTKETTKAKAAITPHPVDFSHFSRRHKKCYFTSVNAQEIDYKDQTLLLNYVTDTKKILPRRVTGTKSIYQRKLAQAIKRARIIGLLPFSDKYDEPSHIA